MPEPFLPRTAWKVTGAMPATPTAFVMAKTWSQSAQASGPRMRGARLVLKTVPRRPPLDEQGAVDGVAIPQGDLAPFAAASAGAEATHHQRPQIRSAGRLQPVTP
jgi:hypothetical protein